MEQSVVNVDLARQLEQAELERLEQGVTDLLALQIREKASYDARLLEVEARAAYFRARANYEAATAARPRIPFRPANKPQASSPREAMSAEGESTTTGNGLATMHDLARAAGVSS